MLVVLLLPLVSKSAPPNLSKKSLAASALAEAVAADTDKKFEEDGACRGCDCD